jgi:hypothetical protein
MEVVMAKARLMTLVGAATVLAAGLTSASAQVLNLTGQFECVRLCLAAPPALAYLTQADWEMNLVNEAGVLSRGWIDYPGHIWVAAWNEGAFYSPDGMIIQFDNGSVWQRVVEVPIVAPVVRRHYRHSTTVTRTTTVRPGVVAAAPVYDELKRGPRLYDVATPAAVAPAVQPVSAAPVLGATTAVGGPVATYRYVYQPDRILVIDPYTNIAVQAIPR